MATEPTPPPSDDVPEPTEAAASSPEAAAPDHSVDAPPEVEATPGPSESLPLRGEAKPRPVVDRAPRDPMAAANAALAAAAARRGETYIPATPGVRKHPLQAAEEALAKARAAREHAEKGGSAGLAREADARRQLDALRSGGWTPPTPQDPVDHTAQGPDPSPPTPKKRTL